MSNSDSKSLFTNLWERRVPQFFATYIGICWGILQFLNFACSRYNFADSLIDKFLLFAAVLIPGVLLFIYNHGRPGSDHWTKLEKFFIPSNFIIAALLAFLVGGGSKASAAPTAVEITTEEGEQITRYVPSSSETRSLAIFPMDMTSESDSWVKIGLPYLLSKDLNQDMRVATWNPSSLEYYMKSYEYGARDKIPFSTKLKIANKTKADYFVIGQMNKEADNWILELKLHETGSGELFQEFSFTDTDFYNLVDDCTKSISSSLFLKENQAQLTAMADLPASDLISTNLEAYSTFIKARETNFFDNDYEKALGLYKEAEALDNKSAEIKKFLSYAVATLGDKAGSQKLIGEALQLSKQLPERQQMAIKESYWSMNDHMDNTLVLRNNWIKLYPQDYEPHKNLLNFYRMTFQLNKAKDIALLAIENGHKERVLPELVDLNILLEEFDEAEKYIKEYHEVYPEIAKEDMRMADIFTKQGKFEQAIEFYQARLLEDPQNGSIYGNLADTYFQHGAFDKAEANYANALKNSSQGPDSALVYIKTINYFVAQGQTSKVEEYLEKWMNCMRSYMPEIGVAQSTMQMAGQASIAGADDFLRSYFDEFTTAMPQMKPAFDCVTNFLYSLFKNDPEELKKYNQGQCKSIVYQSSPDLEYFVNGLLASMEKKHTVALENYNTFIEKSGAGGKEFGYMLAKEYRLMGKGEKAEQECLTALKTAPNNPLFVYELAEAQLAQGNKSKATETYNKLEKLWSKAEPGFTYYDDYISLGKKLGVK